MGNLRATLGLLLAVVAWISLFVVGMALESGSYLQRITAEESTFLESGRSFIQFMTAWTWSNILGLCCVAAVVGEYGRHAMLNRAARPPNLKAAIVRGFFIFLVVAAGQLVIAGNISLPSQVVEATGGGDPRVTSPAQFFRLAAFCSLTAFLVGFTPRIFTSLLNGLHRVAGVPDE